MPRKPNSAYRMEIINKDLGLCDVFEIRHDDIMDKWIVTGGDLGQYSRSYYKLATAQVETFNRYVYRYGYKCISASIHRTN